MYACILSIFRFLLYIYISEPWLDTYVSLHLCPPAYFPSPYSLFTTYSFGYGTIVHQTYHCSMQRANRHELFRNTLVLFRVVWRIGLLGIYPALSDQMCRSFNCAIHRINQSDGWLVFGICKWSLMSRHTGRKNLTRFLIRTLTFVDFRVPRRTLEDAYLNIITADKFDL